MSFDNERGGARHPELETLSSELANDVAKFLDSGGEIPPCEKNWVSTVAEVKELGLLDIENIKVNRKAKRPKG